MWRDFGFPVERLRRAQSERCLDTYCWGLLEPSANLEETPDGGKKE